MEHPKILHDGITFDDVLLIPARSDFVPSDADTHSRLTRAIELNIPILNQNRFLYYTGSYDMIRR